MQEYIKVFMIQKNGLTLTNKQHAVFNFCLENKIKIIYSATSASLGNKGMDKNLSPYAFTKSNNLKMLIQMNKWFNLF